MSVQGPVYVVTSENGKEFLTFVGWIGYQMVDFVQTSLMKQFPIGTEFYEYQSDNSDNIQFFGTKERAKEMANIFRQGSKKPIGKLKIIELEMILNQKDVESL